MRFETRELGTRGKLRGLCLWFLVLAQVPAFQGCRQAGSGRGASASFAGTTAPGATAGPNLGGIIYATLEANLKKTGTQAQLAALQAKKQPFIDAINRTLPTGASSAIWSTLRKFLPLVDDDTIPSGVKDVRAILADMAADAAVCQALADLKNTKPSSSSPGPIDQDDMVRMLSRLLAYPDFENLAKSATDFSRQNTGMVESILGIASRRLQALNAQSFAQGSPVPGMGDLATELLRPADMGGFTDVGAPAWIVLRDKHGNHAVTVDPATRRVLAPFVDDGSGTASINADGKPVDAKGAVITIKPFGTDGSRDSFNRAMAPGGLALFQYVDAKRTTLGQVLILTGEALKKNIGSDLCALLDKMIDRETKTDSQGNTYQVFKRGSPFCDMQSSGMELVRRTPLPQLLSGLAELERQNPAQFDDMVTSLIVAIHKAKQSGFTTNARSTMVDDLIPLLHAATSPNGKSTTAMRALLQEFTKAQARLHDLPKGFARMMKFHDYGKQIPTGPGKPSVMQRLLDVMRRSDQCSPPFLGNLADLYIDTMAGNNKAILGIKLDIHTMNNLMKIGILRSLLCSQLNADDAQVLQDFADTGALDAFIPIAKAFSDRGETRLLVDIMLQTGAHYDADMRPNEPAVIKLLESGAVEKLFSVLDQMTRVKVPGTNSVVADILADTVKVLVDNSRPIYDKKGRAHKTLLNLVMAPMDDISKLAQARGEKARWDRVLQNAMDVFLAVYTDPVTKQEKVRACGLIHALGEILAFVAKQIPADPAQRSKWVDDQQKSFEEMVSDRDLVTVIDMIKTVKASQQAKVFDDAIANLLTPRQNVSQDALGAITALVANILESAKNQTPQAPAQPTNGQAMATLANWVGREIDPAAGKLKRLGNTLMKMMQADDGLLLLRIARNLFDMGPNGTLEAPMMVIMGVLNDVDAAGPQHQGPWTGQQVADGFKKTLEFLDDEKDGLAGIFIRIKGRSPK